MFSTVGVLVLPFPLIMVALGVIARVADSPRPGGPSLWGRLWTLWVCLGYVLAAGAWVCFLRAARPSRWSLLREQYEHHAGPFRGVIRNALGDRARAIAHCGAMFTLALLAPVLLTVPAAGTADIPWSVALIPIWLVFALFLCAPCCGWRLRDELGMFFAILGFWWLPLLVTLILLALRLDGIPIALVWVFMPIWIFGSCACSGATCGTVFGVIRARRENLRCARCPPTALRPSRADPCARAQGRLLRLHTVLRRVSGHLLPSHGHAHFALRPRRRRRERYLGRRFPPPPRQHGA